MHSALRVIVMILAVAPAPAPPKTIRVGTNAGHLSDKDIDKFEKAAGGKPWLIDMPLGQVEGKHASLYLPADKTARDVRGGTVVVFAFGNLSHRGRYAQVAIEGRAFDDIKNSADPNMPFAVADDVALDDAELVSMVRFIRSKPTSPITNTLRVSGPVHGDLPISSITRVTEPRPNAVVIAGQTFREITEQIAAARIAEASADKASLIRVTIREGDLRGQDVLLEKVGDKWVVLSARQWVA